jgi:hypothetical protein
MSARIRGSGPSGAYAVKRPRNEPQQKDWEDDGLDAGLGEQTGEGEGWRSLRSPAEGDINQGPPRLS